MKLLVRSCVCLVFILLVSHVAASELRKMPPEIAAKVFGRISYGEWLLFLTDKELRPLALYSGVHSMTIRPEHAGQPIPPFVHTIIAHGQYNYPRLAQVLERTRRIATLELDYRYFRQDLIPLLLPLEATLRKVKITYPPTPDIVLSPSSKITKLFNFLELEILLNRYPQFIFRALELPNIKSLTIADMGSTIHFRENSLDILLLGLQRLTLTTCFFREFPIKTLFPPPPSKN